MGCDIVFKLNGILRKGLSSQPLEETIENSALESDDKLEGQSDFVRNIKELSLKNIASELIRSKETREKVINLIQNLQSVRRVTPDIIKEEGIVGNIKYHSLRYKYSGDLTFPTLSTPYDPDILLVDRFTNKGITRLDTIYGTDANGNLVYVVEDSIRGVNKLLRHLKVRDLIINNFEDNSELKLLMPLLAKNGKDFDSQKELLLDYITHKSEYVDLLVDKGLYGLLNEIVKNLENKNRNGFINPLDREFEAKLTSIKNTKDYYITIDAFLKIVEKFEPELLEDIQNSKDPEVLSNIFEKFYDNFLEFSGKLIEIRDSTLVIRKNFNSLGSADDLTYDTINKYITEEEIYRGIHIYKYFNGQETRYLYSQDMITPSSNATKYLSIEDVRNRIDERYSQTSSNPYTFSKNFELGFRIIPSYERVNEVPVNIQHIPGSIVQVLDISLDQNTILDNEEASLFIGNKTLEDFYKIFKKQLTNEQFNKLQSIVDSIEKAGIFVYLVNEKLGNKQSTRNFESSEFDTILGRIFNAKYKKYYIQNSKNGYAKVIPIKDTVTIDKTYQRPSPIIDLMIEVIDTFNKKFNVGATLLTQDQINEQFPDIPAGVKAFIRDGNIYINGSIATSEDVIHEYTHLFLGVLKAQNFDNYLKLLDSIINSGYTYVTNTKERLKLIYPNLADSDLNEEVFAKLFGEFLAGKSSNDMFEDLKSTLDSKVKTIFNLASDEDFNLLYKGKVKAIFQRFSKDIGRARNGLDFNRGAIYRQASKWIADQIENGNIIEKC